MNISDMLYARTWNLVPREMNYRRRSGLTKTKSNFVWGMCSRAYSHKHSIYIHLPAHRVLIPTMHASSAHIGPAPWIRVNRKSITGTLTSHSAPAAATTTPRSGAINSTNWHKRTTTTRSITPIGRTNTILEAPVAPTVVTAFCPRFKALDELGSFSGRGGCLVSGLLLLLTHITLYGCESTASRSNAFCLLWLLMLPIL